MSLKQLLENAVSQHQAGNLSAAEQLYHQILAQDPSQHDALNLLGVIAHQSGNLDKALSLFDQAIAAAPKGAAIHFNKGKALYDAGRLEEAQIAYQVALDCDPALLDARLNLGVLLQDSGQTAAAIEHFNTILQHAPDYQQAHYNIGQCCHAQSRFEDARKAFTKALSLNPNNPNAHFAIANTLNELAQHEEAIDHIKTAIKLKPNWPQAYTNWANYLTATDQHEDAIQIFDQAIALDADNTNARVNRSLALLTLGRLEEGWEDYKDRAKSSAPFYRKFDGDLPRWDGESLAGKSILIWSEQGLGEEILFSALITDLAELASTCTMQCSSKLANIFKRSFSTIPNLTIVDKDRDDLSLTDFDYQTSLADLGQWFRTSLTAFPDAKPYLQSDDARSRELRAELEARFGKDRTFIGISWASANPLIGDQKSVPLKMWHPILSIPGATYVNVQYGMAASDIPHLPTEIMGNIVTLDSIDLNGDLDETLATLAALDELVTCSNTTAHLAGAAGIKTNVFVPRGRPRIWYWFLHRSDSPWYRHTALYRQDALGQWDDAIKAVASHIC